MGLGCVKVAIWTWVCLGLMSVVMEENTLSLWNLIRPRRSLSFPLISASFPGMSLVSITSNSSGQADPANRMNGFPRIRKDLYMGRLQRGGV